jgi:Ice-binding-like
VSEIELQWTPPAVGVVSSYNIYRGTQLGNETLYANVAAPAVVYADTNVIPGRSYVYYVTAVGPGPAFLESVHSNEVAPPPVPFAPTPAPLNLGAASSFSVLAATTTTNVGATSISGSLGVSPGNTDPGWNAALIGGTIHLADFVSANAQAAALAAFNAGNALAGAVVEPADLGGLTLGPGVYTTGSSEAITGVLTLDAGGNPDAVWIFQIPTTLTTAVNDSAILLVNGAQPLNVFWLVGSSATLNGGTWFAGVVIAEDSITVGAGVHVNGSLLALTAAVTIAGASTIDPPFGGVLVFYAASSPFAIGDVIYDAASGTYQMVSTAGVTGATRPVFNPVIGGTTTDGSLVWTTLPGLEVVLLPMPPSPPNVPPPPPGPPTGLEVILEN